MTRIKGGCFSLTSRGRLGSKLIYNIRRRKSFVKKYGYSRREKTIYQYFFRLEYFIAFRDWQVANPSIHAVFKNYALIKNISGWNEFLRRRFLNIGCRPLDDFRLGVSRLCAE